MSHLPEGAEKANAGDCACHPERKCPELQGYNRRVSSAQNRDSSLRLRSGQAAFAALRLTCDNARFSMLSHCRC